MGNLTLRMLEEIGRYELGAAPGVPIDAAGLATQAGEALVALHTWRWLEGREVRIRPRALISLTGATWTEATLTLTQTGAFADYDFLSADTFDLASGTGATVGRYEVASRTDDDSIVLATSIGAAANGQTDITGELKNDQVALPSDFDFQAITAIGLEDGLVGCVELTSPQTLMNLRSWGGAGSLVGFAALITWIRSAAGGQPIPRLDMWPASTAEDNAIILRYRGGWKDPADDAEVLSIPGWLNSLFIELYKAVLMGHEEPEGGTVDQRITRLRMGELFRAAITRDGLIQQAWGPMENGWTDWPREAVSRYDIPPRMVTGP